MNDHEKIIRKMRSDHKKLIKQYDEAIKTASVGTQTHTKLLEAKAKANERHRAELVRFGVVPENLGRASATEYRFVSSSPVTPMNDAELENILRSQLKKAMKGMHVTDQDNAARRELDAAFGRKPDDWYAEKKSE